MFNSGYSAAGRAGIGGSVASRIEPVRELFRRAKRPREKNNDHLSFLRQLRCAVCPNDTQTEAAHVRMSCYRLNKPETGVGRKPDDKFTVPLCHDHHAMQHKIGEGAFWQLFRKDPFDLAMYLWGCSGDIETATRILERAK